MPSIHDPEKVNETTESHLSSLLDIIEKYRMITVKRDRLQYIYDQNKAKALKEAMESMYITKWKAYYYQ